jgi:anthranilate synthase component 1
LTPLINLDSCSIAGTHPRGQGESDKRFKTQLINHPKEQAEHIMLLDLGRNDLGTTHFRATGNSSPWK